MTAPEGLRRTPLHEAHVAAGGRMVPFAGWELPVQYRGIGEEHTAVRTAAGLFDVSHMGEIWVEGPRALDAVQRLITNDAGRLAVGQGLYSPMCLPTGGIVDDVTVFRVADHAYLFVVNAATRAKDVAWIEEHAGGAVVRDASDETALLALQGPRAAAVLEAATGRAFDGLRRFHLIGGVALAGTRVTVSRTGYTGEDGFEIAVLPELAPAVWEALLTAGRPHGLVPAGLGARDTLRLEAAYMLYGNDIDETTSPLEAPLGWTVKLDKAGFIGREALLAQKTAGVGRRLVGFEIADRAIPRQHCAIWADQAPAGEVTSGSFSPTLRRPIGLGYVPAALALPGAALQIEVRDRRVPATVVRLPFYRRPAGSGETR
ncbi:MAG: glycine cleavage system aminomethyltransferase GcvT [Armatimonadota bacterium]|nr:glycine cleavage system aminomethyltransferase GcvT [Armatimonadota bacterium]